MLNILQLGTCRLSLRPCGPRRFKFTKFFSTLHNASQVQQTIRFFQGDPLPQHLLGLLFNHESKAGPLTRDAVVEKVDAMRSVFNSFDGFVVEVCSLKNLISDGFQLHYSVTKEMLEGITYERIFDTAENLPGKITKIVNLLGKPIVFVTHQNRANLYCRSIIIKTMQDLGVTYLDPTHLVLEHGFENMMQDENHYTPAMHSHVLAGVTARLNELF